MVGCTFAVIKSLKPVVIILLILAFALQSFGSVWLCVDYQVNREKYEKDCVNKARPLLKCNGKCQLAKKIQEEEQKKQEEAQKGAPKADYLLSSRHFFPQLEFIKIKASNSICLAIPGEEIKMPRTLFRPPCC